MPNWFVAGGWSMWLLLVLGVLALVAAGEFLHPCMKRAFVQPRRSVVAHLRTVTTCTTNPLRARFWRRGKVAVPPLTARR